MKQKLLLALFVLFASIGAMRAAGDVKVTSSKKGDVVITFDKAVTDPSVAGVALSNSDRTVTIKNTVATEVTISSAAVTTVSFSGEMSAVTVDNATIATTSFGSGAKLGSLSITSTAMKTLDCKNLGLTTLTLSGATVLETLNASDNKLATIALPASVITADLSKNVLTTATIPLGSKLTSLNVSDNLLTNALNVSLATGLKTLNLSNNKILTLTTAAPTGCTITWGIQTISATNTTIAANKGFNVKTINTDILNLPGKSYSGASWKIKDGSLYATDNTAHVQSPTYPDEYRFYDNSTKEFVVGTYELTVTVDGRTYKIQDLKVTAAEFTLNWANPVNGTLAVTANASSITSGTLNNVKQGDVLQFNTTMTAGYDKVVYTIEGLEPANGLTAPYAYNPFECTVKGIYKDVATSIVPKVSAVVSGATHVVQYEKPDPNKGGTFSVQKKLGTTSTALNPGDKIATGDELIVTILPSESYTGTLQVNAKVETVPANNVYTYTVSNADKDFNIAVTFVKTDEVKVAAKVDGKELEAAAPTYIDDFKIKIDGGGADKEITSAAKTVSISKNSAHQAQFTITRTASGNENIVLDEVTINGGTLQTVTSTDVTANTITYTVSFSVNADDVIISIKTKKVTPVEIKLVKNDASTKQTQVYDGKSKPVLFTTDPTGLEGQVVVKYKKNVGADLGTTAPIAVGTYKATLTFKETANYVLKTAADLTDFELSIAKADLSINTLPTVTVNKEGTYDITGGKVMFGNVEVKGTFAVTTTGADMSKSHAAEIKFTPNTDADKANFNLPTATVNVIVAGSTADLYKVSLYTPLPKDISVAFYNGNKLINVSTESFIGGTKLTAVVTYPIGTQNVLLEATSVNTTSTATKNASLSTDGKDVYDITLNGTTQYKVTADLANTYKVELKKETKVYTGATMNYTPTNISVADKDGNTTTVTTPVVTYKDKDGNVVPLPIDAGEYTVCVKIAAVVGSYSEFNQEFAGMFVIEKALATVYKWPKASMIAKGMPLSQSALTNGAANIPGTFAWEDATIVPPTEGGKYKAIFTPAATHSKNYKTVTTPAGTSTEEDLRIKVTVSDLQLVTFAPQNGTITVINQKGVSLSSGNAVSKGDVLTITATPDESFELKTMTVNGNAYTGAYTVGNTSVAIKAEFQVKSLVDPNTQYTVTLPSKNAVKGVVVNKPGVNAVKKDTSFSFTLSHLAADKPVVKIGDAVLTPSETGVYSIAKVTANTTITVTLAAPTKIKVGVEKITKNAKGYKLGSVQVQGLATDSSCYYGDVITLVAFPESGVTFHSWSDVANADNPRSIAVTTGLTIKPQFTGVPTGIDDIEGTKVYGAEGYIYVSCEGQATVTVIALNGGSQQIRIVGEARIETRTGVYSVILQQGAETMKKKVLVH